MIGSLLRRSGVLVLLWLLACACRPAATSVPPSPTVTPVASQPPRVGELVPLWTFQTRGAIWGTPAVSDGTVYVGSDDGNLYAVDSRSGSLQWKFATQGIIRSRPAVVGNLVYIASDDGNAYAVDVRDGTPVWSTEIGNRESREEREHLEASGKPTGFDIWQSSPVVANGQVFVGSLDGNVYALAADTGAILWTFKTGDKIRATLAVASGTVFVGSWDKALYALDAATGSLRWKSMLGGQVQTTALFADGVVYCASRKASVVAVDARNGEFVWEYD